MSNERAYRKAHSVRSLRATQVASSLLYPDHRTKYSIFYYKYNNIRVATQEFRAYLAALSTRDHSFYSI